MAGGSHERASCGTCAGVQHPRRTRARKRDRGWIGVRALVPAQCHLNRGRRHRRDERAKAELRPAHGEERGRQRRDQVTRCHDRGGHREGRDGHHDSRGTPARAYATATRSRKFLPGTISNAHVTQTTEHGARDPVAERRVSAPGHEHHPLLEERLDVQACTLPRTPRCRSISEEVRSPSDTSESIPTTRRCALGSSRVIPVAIRGAHVIWPASATARKNVRVHLAASKGLPGARARIRGWRGLIAGASSVCAAAWERCRGPCASRAGPRAPPANRASALLTADGVTWRRSAARATLRSNHHFQGGGREPRIEA